MHKMAQLIIERRVKPILIGEGGNIIKRVQNMANVKISSFSQELDQVVLSGEDNFVDVAIREFLGMYLLIIIRVSHEILNSSSN